MKYTRPNLFSFHAVHRLGQRTQLTSTDVIRIIGERKFVDIGAKPGVHRRHLLFYSVPDQVHFVAIQDPIDGTLITILPLEYHEHLAWNASDEQLSAARSLAERPPAPRSLQSTPATTFCVTAYYVDEFGCPKQRLIAKLKTDTHGSVTQELLRDQFTLRTMIHSALSKGVDPRAVESISIRAGTKGDPMCFDLRGQTSLASRWAASAAELSGGPPDLASLGTDPAGFYVSCRIRVSHAQVVVKPLGKVQSGSYGHSFRKLLADEGFFDWVSARALMRQLAPESIEGIYLRLGKLGERFLVEIDEISPSGVAFVRPV
jgi:hypothetical protein